MASVRNLMNKKNQRCHNVKVAAVMRLTNFVNAPTSDSVKIGVPIETTIVL